MRWLVSKQVCRNGKLRHVWAVQQQHGWSANRCSAVASCGMPGPPKQQQQWLSSSTGLPSPPALERRGVTNGGACWRTSAQLMPANQGCRLISSAPALLPSRLPGSCTAVGGDEKEAVSGHDVRERPATPTCLLPLPAH